MSTVRGTVRWFSPRKGYGFVIPEDGDQDVFVHKVDLPEGVEDLEPGVIVTVEVEEGSTRASKVLAIEGFIPDNPTQGEEVLKRIDRLEKAVNLIEKKLREG